MKRKKYKKFVEICRVPMQVAYCLTNSKLTCDDAMLLVRLTIGSRVSLLFVRQWAFRINIRQISQNFFVLFRTFSFHELDLLQTMTFQFCKTILE